MRARWLCMARLGFCGREQRVRLRRRALGPGAALVAILCLSAGCALGEVAGPTAIEAQDRGSFRATGATIIATPEVYEGACPQRVQVRAQITTDGPVSVKYEWESDGGYTQPEQVVVFDRADMREVGTSLPVSGSSTGWVRLRITLPNALASSEASYVITCDGSD
jgi:hypothetical protein